MLFMILNEHICYSLFSFNKCLWSTLCASRQSSEMGGQDSLPPVYMFYIVPRIADMIDFAPVIGLYSLTSQEVLEGQVSWP